MSDYDGVLIENIWHELKAIREGYESLAHVPRTLDSMNERLGHLESDMKAIKAVITNHEGRIIRLEDVVLP